MVQNIINVGEFEDRILNIVKARYGLKNKSQAIEVLVKIYAESFLEPELMPEFLDDLKKIRKGKYFEFKDIHDLKSQIED